MREFVRLMLSRSSAAAIMACSVVALAACTSSSPSGHVKTSASKEYFSETEYGVPASPRVTNLRSRLPRGGGRDMVGKPYKVHGKWYKPREQPGYSKVGAASWYGDAFHGRLTANGEIYDMTHLTAAHPTMPLPSYARVTNTKNGASVIVRVNDRGPFAHNRIIDLSKRAAELLDYSHAGVAKVKVEYVGRAPLHGKDDQYLMASYRPGRGGSKLQPQLPGMEDGLPTGVMIAMNGDTPTAGRNAQRRSLFAALPASRTPIRNQTIAASVQAPTAQPVQLASAAPQPASGADFVELGDPVLPDFGPTIPERPLGGIASDSERLALPIMSYADRRVRQAATPFKALGNLDAANIVASWKRATGKSDRLTPTEAAMPTGEYLAAGTFATAAEAKVRANLLADLGNVAIVADAGAYSVVMHANGSALDGLARRAWEKGATDAFIVHFE